MNLPTFCRNLPVPLFRQNISSQIRLLKEDTRRQHRNLSIVAYNAVETGYDGIGLCDTTYIP